MQYSFVLVAKFLQFSLSYHEQKGSEYNQEILQSHNVGYPTAPLQFFTDHKQSQDIRETIKAKQFRKKIVNFQKNVKNWAE